jgi:16S rRNA G1207 methylase RsmC
VGCGYGTIALFLGYHRLAEEIVGLERDALALEYARKNGETLGLKNIEWRAGLAYEAVEGQAPFDLLAINLPAKVGDPVHRHILMGAAERLNEGGEVWTVAVRPLEEEIEEILNVPAIEIMERYSNAGYQVLRFRFAGRPAPLSNPYLRKERPFELDGVDYTMRTYYGLPEFDTPSRTSLMAAECILDNEDYLRWRHVAVIEPGQGHPAVFLARRAPDLEKITLLSRDALALRSARGNLADLEPPPEVVCVHGLALPPGARPDACLIFPPPKEGQERTARRILGALAGMDENGQVLVACGVSLGGRLDKILKKYGVSVFMKRKRRGAFVCRARWNEKGVRDMQSWSKGEATAES